MGETGNFIPAEAPAQILNDRTRCMDERILLETEEHIKEFGTDDIESFQAPGGDGFYPVARDIIREAVNEGSVDHGVDESFREVFQALDDKGHRTAVHNDDHGEQGTIEHKYGGCGFLGKLQQILDYSSKNVENIIADVGVEGEKAERMRLFAPAAGRLANPQYVNRSGEELVQLAVTELGAHLWALTGEHDGLGVLINRGDGTHHVRKANNIGNPWFNVDTPPVKQTAESKLGLSPVDTEAVLELLTVAAVDVLKPGSEVQTR